jgi:O-antigen/teichoic acid export membrane protein
VQFIFCLLATAGSVIATLLYLWIDRSGIPSAFVLPFTAAVALFLMQDWLRRYYFTTGKAAASILNDAISYAGQVAVLIGLWAAHWLTIGTAFWAIALTSGLAFAAGASLEHLGSTRLLARAAWRRIRSLSIDLGISNQLQWLVYQGAMLVGASVAGPQAAGGVRATQNVIGPVNIAYQAMENIVPIRAAEEMRRSGIRGASRFLFRFGTAGFVGLLLLFLAASLLSERFLSFFYGQQLRAYADVLNLQMLYFLLAWPIRQLNFLFRTVENTRPILMASVVAAVLSMALVYPLVRGYGALGIVMAAVAGQIGNLAWLAIAWMRVSAGNGKMVGTAAEAKS